MDFEQFWDLIAPDISFQNRYNAAQKEWELCSPRKQQAIMDWLRIHGSYSQRNPYFFIKDFKPDPPFLHGDEKGDLVMVRYKGLYKICTRETMQQFKLEYVRDW
jgi:hypothetical protein